MNPLSRLSLLLKEDEVRDLNLPLNEQGSPLIRQGGDIKFEFELELPKMLKSPLCLSPGSSRDIVDFSSF